MKRALVSVTDKTGIVDFCKQLIALDFQIISTGGTLGTLQRGGVEAISIEEVTGFPEMLDGRVKTLHPFVHGGLLYKRDNPQHCQTVASHQIPSIDMVVVNLYDFEGTLKSGKSQEEIIENIDIGGPSMLRSAAKNYRDVLVVTTPVDYQEVLERLASNSTDQDFRQALAYKAFTATAYYDAMISRYFAGLQGQLLPDKLVMGFQKQETLRYGENPHQQAALYHDPLGRALLSRYEQLQGKELSFNNLNDLTCAVELAREFDQPVAVAVKHATPCGVAVGNTGEEAFAKAYEGDQTSIFGGIIAMNRPVEKNTATLMKDIFLEVIAAPSFSAEALEILAEKKNLRLLILDFEQNPSTLHMKFIQGKLLVQESDQEQEEELRIVTQKSPTDRERQDMLFAMKVCKHVKSNAIVLAKDGGTLAIGGGQTARIWALKNAVENAEQDGKRKDFNGAVMASDAFFPFDDCVTYGADHGITAIIQPGGAQRDDDSIRSCDDREIAMVFTGIRHFKH